MSSESRKLSAVRETVLCTWHIVLYWDSYIHMNCIQFQRVVNPLPFYSGVKPQKTSVENYILNVEILESNTGWTRPLCQCDNSSCIHAQC